MPESAETIAFIKNNFRSVWSLELLLLLKSSPDRAWPSSELVGRLRGSVSVVAQSVESLLVAGLVVTEEGGAIRYAPASRDLERLVGLSEQLYAKRPDAVRRLIVLSSNDQLNAFADAFRLRRD